MPPSSTATGSPSTTCHRRSSGSSGPNHRAPGIYVVSLDESRNKSAAYLHGTFHWHIDGCTPEGDECPQMATVLTAVAVAEQGGETEFASTYAAYDDLIDDEK